MSVLHRVASPDPRAASPSARATGSDLAPIRIPSPEPSIQLPVTPLDHRSRGVKEVVPVPWMAMFPILMYRLADAVTYCVVFPFVTEMVTSFGTAPDKIGFYAGLGEGIMMAVEAIVATTWAKLADKYGRRPCLIWGGLAMLPAVVMTGFVKSVWALCLWRAIYGLSPAAIIGRIYMSEISHPSNRAKMYSFFSPAFSVGLMLGDLIGGELASPYGRLPAWLGGRFELWREYPYAFPIIVAAAMSLLAILTSLATLIETRPPSLGPLSPHPDSSETGIPEPLSEKAAQPTIRDTLRVPGFAMVVSVFCMFQLAAFMFEGIYTVYTYTEIERGGLGMPVTSIGILLAVSSLLYISLVPIALPPLQAKWGNVKTIRYVSMVWPFFAASIPLAQWSATTGSGFLLWAVLILQLMLKTATALAWPMTDVILTGCFDPYPNLLATGQAVSLIAGAIGRSVGPSISGFVYSQSGTYPRGSLGRQMAWLAVLVVSLSLVVGSRYLPVDHEHDTSTYDAVPLEDAGLLAHDDSQDDVRKHDHRD